MPASCASIYLDRLNRFKTDFKLSELDKWILFVSKFRYKSGLRSVSLNS